MWSGANAKTGDNKNLISGNSENSVSSYSGDKNGISNMGSGLGDSNEQANLWSSCHAPRPTPMA